MGKGLVRTVCTDHKSRRIIIIGPSADDLRISIKRFNENLYNNEQALSRETINHVTGASFNLFTLL